MSEQVLTDESNHSNLKSENSAGALLREARVAAGVSVESIAFALKVSTAKIVALESNDFSAFSDITFMRALAASVCRGLRIESAAVLALLPHPAVPNLAKDNHKSRSNVYGWGSGLKTQQSSGRRSRWLGLAVVLLMIGAALVAWTPLDWVSSKLALWQHSASSNENISAEPSVVVFSSDVPGDATNANSPSLALPNDNSSVSVKNSSSTSDISAGEPPVSGALPTTLVYADKVAGESKTLPKSDIPRLDFSARGETWVQVKDKSKKIVLERVLKSGETASVVEAGELFVVVGRADVTDVSVAGEPRDIVTTARNNVARFELAE